MIGLLLGTRYLALAGAPAATLRPARRLLILASVVTLALNVADPLVAGDFGKAAFDAVGPLLLIGWAEVGPVESDPSRKRRSLDELLEHARREDAAHRSACQKPTSDTLRARLNVGAERARQLVQVVRAEYQARDVSRHTSHGQEAAAGGERAEA